MPEIIDPVFAKTSPKRSFSVIENERFGVVFAKTGAINSGTGGAIRTAVVAPSRKQTDGGWRHLFYIGREVSSFVTSIADVERYSTILTVVYCPNVLYLRITLRRDW